MNTWLKDIAQKLNIKSVHVEYLAAVANIDLKADDQPLASEMISVYLMMVPLVVVRDMEHAHRDFDFETMRRKVSLMGLGSARIGARGLAKLCADLEVKLTCSAGLEEIQVAFDSLISEIGRVTEELKQLSKAVKLHERASVAVK